jgi:hypothetical protein
MGRKSRVVSRRKKNYKLEFREGQLVKQIPIPAELASELHRQKDRFRAKFGREPGPNDPIFFDPNADEPLPFNAEAAFEELVAIAGQIGIAPQLIYAMNKTGRMVTEDNQQFLTPSELQEWNEAIAEYFQKVKQSGVM